MSRDARRGTWRTIKLLERSVPQVKWYRGELVLMSLFVNIFALGLPIFILQVYDRVLPNLGLTTMQFLVVGLIAVMLLDFFLKTIRAAVTTYTGARFEHLARVSAIDHILRTPQDVYEKDTPGVYLDKVNAIGVVKDFYSSQLGTLLIDLPFAIFFLGMIWFLGGVMVLVPIGLLTLFGLMAIVVGGNLRRAVDTRSKVDNRRYDFLIEIISGIHTVKAQAFKNLLQRRFETLQEMSARAVRSVAMQSSIAQGLGSTFGQLNMACVIGTGAILVIDGSLTAGELAACTLLSGRAMQPLQSAMGLWTNFQTIRVACDNALAVLELPAENLDGLPEMPPVDGRIEFRNVTFGYAGMPTPLINNLNLDIAPGEMIGIEGDNSSGRSTLLKLMVGLIRPNQGQVLIDGYDLSKHQSESYRAQMAFLTADADVYSGTILDNMTYFRGGKFIRKAMQLSKQLGLDEEIKRLPEGYGTMVGDGAGGVLPAGFVQRITIVRAMIDDPQIVLFDNANHGLDSATDKILLDYFDSLRGKSTVILVSARPSWLRIADRRYVMAQGSLTAKETETAPALPSPESKQMPPATETPSRTVEPSASNGEPTTAKAPIPTDTAPLSPEPQQEMSEAPPASRTPPSPRRPVKETGPERQSADTKQPPAPNPTAAPKAVPKPAAAKPRPAAPKPAAAKPKAAPKPAAARPKKALKPAATKPQAETAPEAIRSKSATGSPQPVQKAPSPQNASKTAPATSPNKAQPPRSKPPAQKPAAAAAKPKPAVVAPKAAAKSPVPPQPAIGQTAAPKSPARPQPAIAPTTTPNKQPTDIPARAATTQPSPRMVRPRPGPPAAAAAPQPATSRPRQVEESPSVPPQPVQPKTAAAPTTAARTTNADPPAPANPRPQPKPAATLRAAPNAAASQPGRKDAAVLRPQPPRPRAPQPANPGGGE